MPLSRLCRLCPRSLPVVRGTIQITGHACRRWGHVLGTGHTPPPRLLSDDRTIAHPLFPIRQSGEAFFRTCFVLAKGSMGRRVMAVGSACGAPFLRAWGHGRGSDRVGTGQGATHTRAREMPQGWEGWPSVRVVACLRLRFQLEVACWIDSAKSPLVDCGARGMVLAQHAWPWLRIGAGPCLSPCYLE